MLESDCRPDRPLGSSPSIYHPCPQQPRRGKKDRNQKTGKEECPVTKNLSSTKLKGII